MKTNLLSSLVVLLLLAGGMLSATSCSKETEPLPEPWVEFRKTGMGAKGGSGDAVFYERHLIEAVYLDEFARHGYKREIPQRFPLSELGIVLNACRNAEARIKSYPHTFQATFSYMLGGYTYHGVGLPEDKASQSTTYYSVSFGANLPECSDEDRP